MLEHYSAFIAGAQMVINEMDIPADQYEVSLSTKDGRTFTFYLDEGNRIMAVVHKYDTDIEAINEWVN
jgi:hypothetical protein